MSQKYYGSEYGASAPENYERYFVPAIGAPVAEGLMKQAALGSGERVLDVACGTGVVTRLASRAVGDTGKVAGLDINPGMLAVARSKVPSDHGIEWYESGADAMPFDNDSFDVVLCQMGLQFMPDRQAALAEMRRVLAPGGRLVFNVPGPVPEPFSIMADALARHVDPEAAGFVHVVFDLHDTEEIENLIHDAGFEDASVDAQVGELRLPPASDFLWQYVYSTPMAALVAPMSEQDRQALERDVVSRWQPFERDGALRLEVRMVTARARK